MKQEAAPRPQSETDESFTRIIENEYGADAAQQIVGGIAVRAVRQTLPFGDQFMSDLPEIPANPVATTPGGQTITTDDGTASLDDPSSSDVF